ncbi:28450_t:CDS:2, partial [Racocetra persica]
EKTHITTYKNTRKECKAISQKRRRNTNILQDHSTSHQRRKINSRNLTVAPNQQRQQH